MATRQRIGFIIRFEMRLLEFTGTLVRVVFFIGFLLGMEYLVFAQLEKRLFEWRDETSVGRD